MYRKIRLIIFLGIFVFAQQAIAAGCVVGTQIYTEFDSDGWLTGTRYYKDDVSRPTTFPNCPRASLTSATGKACTVISGWNWLGFPVTVATGNEFNFVILTPPVGCPIDDYIPYFTIVIALLVAYQLKYPQLKNC